MTSVSSGLAFGGLWNATSKALRCPGIVASKYPPAKPGALVSYPAFINGIEGGGADFLDTATQQAEHGMIELLCDPFNMLLSELLEVAADGSQIESLHQLAQVIIGKRLIQAPERVIRPGHVSQYRQD